MLKSYKISPRHTLVGTILNGNSPSLPIKFGEAVTYDYFIRLMSNLQNPGIGNNLNNVFQLARTSLFSEENGARAGVPKTLIVFINSKVIGDIADLKEEANVLQATGVKIVFVGIGPDAGPDEVKEIVDVWFFPEDLPSMERIIYPVIRASYPGKFCTFLLLNYLFTSAIILHT